MKLYGGIDLHSNNSVVVLIDEEGREILRKRIANDLIKIVSLLEPWRSNLLGVVVESTYNWYWLVDGLMESGFKVHLANTAAIQQYSGVKYTDDTSDARWLSELLRLGILPEGYIYPKEQRTARDLMRKRMQLVQQSTLNVQSIQGLYARHLNKRISANKIKQLTAEQVDVDFLIPHVALAVKSNLVVMNCLQEQINTLEKVLKKDLRLERAFEQLTSIDGIGLVLALTIMLETGAISRFDTVGDYASYCRCISGAKFSNGKKKGNTNSKNGNKFLAWAFTEAANFAIRYNETVKQYYQRKLAKTNKVVAIKTVAHKLARACFYVLRDQVEFNVQKAFM
ncbi:IS110 family RNA-guided transposase [Legionella tunisiensis]|uniref:IS110 family transposase n=1 Tax=Legionella tunisiensis TaxID=1034944 RepID=UPI0002F517FD|nr:IS110 family transposase [Legionella tunisiensis]